MKLPIPLFVCRKREGSLIAGLTVSAFLCFLCASVFHGIFENDHDFIAGLAL